MKLGRSFHFPMALFGIMPMLNVLLLVIVFYELGSKFAFTPGIQVSLPATSFALGPQRNAEIVSLTAGPVAAIYHRDREVTLEELRMRFSENQSVEKTLIIKADKNTPAGLVAAVTDEALKRSYSVIIAGDITKK